MNTQYFSLSHILELKYENYVINSNFEIFQVLSPKHSEKPQYQKVGTFSEWNNRDTQIRLNGTYFRLSYIKELLEKNSNWHIFLNEIHREKFKNVRFLILKDQKVVMLFENETEEKVQYVCEDLAEENPNIPISYFERKGTCVNNAHWIYLDGSYLIH